MNRQDTKPSALNRSIFTLVNIGIGLVLIIFLYYIFDKGPNQTLEPIIIATGEWAPYSGENLDSYGIASAIVTKVFHDIGYVAQFQFMPWPTAEDKAAQSEDNDGVRGCFPYIKSEGRESNFYFSDPIMRISYGIFYHEQNNPEGAKIKNQKDLEKHLLIPLSGYEYGEDLKAHIKFDPQSDSTDNLQAFLRLGQRKGEPLIVVEAVKVGTELLEQKLPHLVSHIKMAPFQGTLDYYFIFSKRNPNNLTLRNDFNKQLKEYKKNKSAFLAFQKEVLNKIEMSRAVILEPVGDHQMIHAFRDTIKNEYVLLPKGSKALVKSWGSQYLDYHHPTSKALDTLVKVKILNGPLSLRDSILYVDARSIRLP